MKTLLPWAILCALALLPVSAADSTNQAPAADANQAPADAAWEQLQEQVQGAQAVQEPAARGKLDRALFASAGGFISKYPNDPHLLEVRMLWAQVGEEMAQLGLPDAPSGQQMAQALDELSRDPHVPLPKRAEIRFVQIAESLEKASQASTPQPAKWKAIDDRIAAFSKDFGPDFSVDGQTPVILELRNIQLSALQIANDPGYGAMLQKLVTDSNPAVAQLAQDQIAQEKQLAELKKKPLDLKFTAVDGRQVDLADLRGKVVLIDFWATWCEPCVEEVPSLVAAYQKLHARSFEVVGISLDQDKDKLVSFTKSHDMGWPQYFDGKGWQNEISHRFGIEMVPTMWLVDKRGYLAETEVRVNLAGRVEALLGK